MARRPSTAGPAPQLVRRETGRPCPNCKSPATIQEGDGSGGVTFGYRCFACGKTWNADDAPNVKVRCGACGEYNDSRELEYGLCKSCSAAVKEEDARTEERRAQHQRDYLDTQRAYWRKAKHWQDEIVKFREGKPNTLPPPIKWCQNCGTPLFDPQAVEGSGGCGMGKIDLCSECSGAWDSEIHKQIKAGTFAPCHVPKWWKPRKGKYVTFHCWTHPDTPGEWSVPEKNRHPGSYQCEACVAAGREMTTREPVPYPPFRPIEAKYLDGDDEADSQVEERRVVVDEDDAPSEPPIDPEVEDEFNVIDDDEEAAALAEAAAAVKPKKKSAAKPKAGLSLRCDFCCKPKPAETTKQTSVGKMCADCYAARHPVAQSAEDKLRAEIAAAEAEIRAAEAEAASAGKKRGRKAKA